MLIERARTRGRWLIREKEGGKQIKLTRIDRRKNKDGKMERKMESDNEEWPSMRYKLPQRETERKSFFLMVVNNVRVKGTDALVSLVTQSSPHLSRVCLPVALVTQSSPHLSRVCPPPSGNRLY